MNQMCHIPDRQERRVSGETTTSTAMLLHTDTTDDEHLVDSDAAPLTPCPTILVSKDLITLMYMLK